jgi:hypothetical protein
VGGLNARRNKTTIASAYTRIKQASVDPHLPSKSSGTRSFSSSTRVTAKNDYVAATPSQAVKEDVDHVSV